MIEVATSQRAIPDDNLAYPVLFTSPKNIGSGFYLNTSSSMYLVTAKHVIFDEAGNLISSNGQLLSYSKDPKDDSVNIIALDLVALQATGQIKAHKTMDVAVVKVAAVTKAPPDVKAPEGSSWLQGVPGTYSIKSSANGVLGVSLDSILRYGDVLVGNEIIVFGYPNSIGLQQIPQIDPLRPLLRKGVIAGKNPSLKTVIIDCASFPGNSGGPVLQIVDLGFGGKKFQIIGVVSQFVPFDNSRFNIPLGQRATLLNSDYSVIVPMDFVLELIE